MKKKREGRRELPFVFAGSATASGDAAAVALSPVDRAGGARRLLVTGTLVEGTASQIMVREHADATAPIGAPVGRGPWPGRPGR